MTSTSGRNQTFAGFVRRHQAALYGFALRLSGNSADAADLVQDTLERTLRCYDQLPPDANERAWAATILRHRFIDGCRRKKRTPIHELITAAAAPVAPEETQVESEAAPPWLDITPEQVQAALAQIGDEFRVVYELATTQKRSYKQIAAQLQLPAATVGTRLIRARRKLRRLLTPLVREAA
jgi:RNA polymerase sigma-70 factor (ECF subfamily)